MAKVILRQADKYYAMIKLASNKIIDSCIESGLPEPIMKEEQGGASVTFLKDIYTEKHLQNLDIHERQIKAIL